MNKTILLGRLSKEPDIKFSQTNNIKVAMFSLAVNRKYVKQGEERQSDFFNVIAYSKLADFTEKYLKKGLQVCISGRLQNRFWDDNDGQRHYATEIIAEEIYFADGPKKADESILYGHGINTPTENTNNTLPEGDDLPF